MISFTGAPHVFSGDINNISDTQEMDLGAKVIGNDGSEYRYVKVGATAIVPGKLYDSPALLANHANCLVAAAAAVGATSVTVTLGATAVTANQYAGGKMIVNDETGEGFTYYISSHPAAAASASLVVTLETQTPIRTALTTSSQVTLIPNIYNGVVLHVAGTETGVPVGVGFRAITALYYGFIQTRGAISCLADAAPAALGQAVGASTTTDGACTLMVLGASGIGVAPIGQALAQGVSTEYNPIFLML